MPRQGQYPVLAYKPGNFTEQLERCEYGTFKQFQFGAIGKRISIQAGWGDKSAFIINGIRREYPFLGDEDSAWRLASLWEGDITDRTQRQNALFPPEDAIEFEVRDAGHCVLQ